MTVAQQKYFLCSLIDDRPAMKAGLRVGDAVLSIHGPRADECPLLQDSGRDPGMDLPMGYVLNVTTKDPITFEVRHTKGGKVETIVFAPNEICLLDGTKSSIRV